MADKPILFSGPLVRAILAGQKTETRRVVKGGPWLRVMRNGGEWLGVGEGDVDDRFLRCPYGKPGDRLYVRETWAPKHHRGVKDGPATALTAHYRASEPDCVTDRWRPSIHMPKRLARTWLQVEDIGVERVQDIDEDGAEAEGLGCGFARERFRELWDDINAKRGSGWDLNPWVWVVRFSVLSTDARPS